MLVVDTADGGTGGKIRALGCWRWVMLVVGDAGGE